MWTVNFGVHREHDARFGAMLGVVYDLIERRGVTHIGLEAPVQARMNTSSANGLLMGLSAVVRGWAHRKGVPVQMFPPQTVAKHFIGNGALKRDAKKAAIIAECRARGWAPEDDNQADAGAVWDITCARLSPAYAAATGPLFNRGSGVPA